MSEKLEVRHQTVMDDEARQVARVYADALYKSAESQGKVEDVLTELTQLLEVFQQNPLLEMTLGSAAIGRDRKEAILKSAFEGRTTQVFSNFLGTLNHHDRLDMVRVIADAYRTLHDRKSKRLVVHVRSAVPLTDSERGRLCDDVRHVAGFEPILQEAVDPEILGGMIVRVQDWIYDASVRTRLDTIRNQLVERSSHGIQSGRDRFRTD